MMMYEFLDSVIMYNSFIYLFTYFVNNYTAVEGEVSIESCRQATKRLLILQFLCQVLFDVMNQIEKFYLPCRQPY